MLGSAPRREGSSSTGDSLYRSESAAAAALAAVAGLKPNITVPPPRSTAPKPGRKAGADSFHSGPQMPSVEETKAAVMAALGNGPRATGLTRSGSSSSLTGGGGGGQDVGGGADGAEAPAQQQRKASRVTSEAPAAPRRNVVAATGLFSNVIGQLRRQSTARDSADTQDGGDEGGSSSAGNERLAGAHLW